jgi:hypothetical protein
MSSPTSIARINIHIARNAEATPDPNCCIGINGNPDIGTGRKCKRSAVWVIVGRGRFCHRCFEIFHASNWRGIRVEDVIRLSDRDEDFNG